MKKDLRKAEKFLGEALELNPNHQRTKREIVNVYIMNENYKEGLALAKENFMRKKLILFIFKLILFAYCMIMN